MHAAEGVAGHHTVIQRLCVYLFSSSAALEENHSFRGAGKLARDCKTSGTRPDDAEIAIEARCGLRRREVANQSNGPLVTPATRKLFRPMPGDISETAELR